MTPFDYLNAINTTKEELNTSDYVPFMVNRGLSYFQDTVLLANEMNKFPATEHKLQFDFLKNSIRARRRFSKWHKAEKVSKDVEVIKKAYGYSREKAEQVINILTKEQIKELKKIYGI